MGQTLASTPALNRRRLIRFAVFLIGAAGFWIVWSQLRPAEFPTTGRLSQEWNTHRQKILSDPAINRYYSFQDLQSSVGHFKSQAGWRKDLTIAATETAPGEPSFHMVEGRWLGKRAVRLDQMPLESRPHQIEDRSFSIETWVRHLGGGMQLGGNTESEGTIVAVGDGVWVGWRLVMLYPCNSLVFELGRPKPQPPVGVASMSRVPPNVWTHVVCTWDGKNVCLYINGVLSGQKAISEGQGTLLDNCMVLFGSGMSDGNRHDPDNLPILLAGRAGGSLKPGEHIAASSGSVPLCNLYLSMLDRMGVKLDRFGDSTGRLLPSI